MNFRRLRTGLGLVAFLFVASAGAGVAQMGTSPNAPPPPPLPNSATVTPATTPPTAAPLAAPSAIVPAALPTNAPAASPSPGPRRGHKHASTATPSPEPSDTPPPPQFKTLDGIWEVELQPIGKRLAKYQHFSIVQSGSALSGYWEHDPHLTRTPITGTYDGHLIQISAPMQGGTVTFTGYVEDMGDMVGMQHLTDGDAGIAFTAEHRKKEKD